jgi:uncharacterized membrane protein YqjE
VPLPVQQVHSGYAQAIPQMPGPSGIQVGNESVAKINVNRSVNVAGVPGMSGAMMGMPGQVRAEGIPSMQVGDGSVVKAEIDASTNIHHNHSLHVQGQYVANQTVVQEVSVGALVALLTGRFTDEDALKAEKEIQALPNKPAELQQILAQTLRFLVRESKRRFKKQEGLFNFSNGSMGQTVKERMEITHGGGINSTDRKRLNLCQQVLDKLHEIAHQSRDRRVLEGIEKLDDSLLKTEQVMQKILLASIAKMFTILGMVAIPVFGIPILFQPNIKVENVLLLELVVFAAIACPGIWYIRHSQAAIGSRLTEVEATLTQLVEGGL